MKQPYSSWLTRRLARPLAALGLLLATAGAAQAQTLAFAPVATYTSGGTTPYGLATGDVNGDGRPDLVTLNSGSYTVAVLLGSSTTPGTFGAPTTYASGGTTGNAISVALGDVNGDGRLDVVTTNDGSNTVGVLLNSPTTPGTFGPVTTYSTGSANGPRVVALGDVNGDNRLDIATAAFNAGFLSILLNSATTPGTFGAPANYSTGGSSTTGIALGDLNRDGRLDALTLDRTTGNVAVFLNPTATPGTFGTPTIYSNGANSASSFGLTLGDLNGDNRPDVVTANLISPTVSVLLNSATAPGTLQAATVYSSGGTSPIEVAVSDLNGDSRADIVVSNYGSNQVGVLLNSTTTPGTFATPVSFSTGASSAQRALVLADLNADGLRDIATANYGSNTIGVLLNTTVQAPTLTTISPTSGPVGRSVTLTGTNLTGATAVSFNGTAATTFAVVNATTITATVPTGATTGNLTVTTPGGTSGGVAFTVVAPTTVTSINRASSSPTNAASVSYTVTFAAAVTGVSSSNFALATTGSVAGAGITGVSGAGTTYTVAVSTGTGDGTLGLNLANATGLSPGVSNVPFTGQAYTIDKTAPTVTITSPTAPNGGYTTTSPLTFVVTFSEAVMGYNFANIASNISNAATGSVDATAAPTYTVTLVPATAGAVTVSVPAGIVTDAAGNANVAAVPPTYTIYYKVPTAAPVLTTPANGATLATGLPTYAGTAPAGSTVTVFVNGASVGTTTAPNGTFSLTQPSALAPGQYTVYATALASGQAVSAASNTNTFTVATAPTVTLLSPATGPVGTQVTITGTNLSGATAVSFNGTAASSFVVNSATSLTAIVAAGTTTGPVRVTTPGGTATSAMNFVVRVAPTTVADTYTTPQNTTLTGNVLTNDLGTNPRAILIIRPTHGTLALNPDGTFTYQPAAGYTGPDSFIYYACDPALPLLCGNPATVSITVVRVAPITVADAYTTPQNTTLTGNVLTNDIGTNPQAILIIRPTRGTLLLNPDGTFTYRPNAGFVGQDSFLYYACNQGTPLVCGDPATVTITVTPSTNTRVATSPTAVATSANSSSPAATADKPAATTGTGAIVRLELALTAHPNPFRDELQLHFTLPIAQTYTLAIYDAQGRLVQQLASGQAEASQAQELTVPTHTYATGLYLVRLTTATGTQQLKLIKQ